MPFDLAATVVRHQRINSDHFLLTLEAPAIARAARAGQFVMLQVREGRDPLLRRPMSIARVPPGRKSLIQILYKVVGEGTRHLARRRVGAILRTLGPLGNGFALPAPRRRTRANGALPRDVLIAGGIGVAIFPFLAETLLKRGSRPLLLFGGRSRRDLVWLPFFRARGVTPTLATEDGSAGTKGYVTQVVGPVLSRLSSGSGARFYVCGPTPMLRAVSALALEHGIPCQIALESQMPCGIGVCLGCVVRCRDAAGGPAYRRVCTEGPVFDAAQVAP